MNEKVINISGVIEMITKDPSAGIFSTGVICDSSVGEITVDESGHILGARNKIIPGFRVPSETFAQLCQCAAGVGINVNIEREPLQGALVLIVAPPKQGKTTIAEKIARKLRADGAQVTLNDDDTTPEIRARLFDIELDHCQPIQVKTLQAVKGIHTDVAQPAWKQIPDELPTYELDTGDIEITVEESAPGEFTTCGTFDGCGHELKATNADDAKKEALRDLKQFLASMLYQIRDF